MELRFSYSERGNIVGSKWVPLIQIHGIENCIIKKKITENSINFPLSKKNFREILVQERTAVIFLYKNEVYETNLQPWSKVKFQRLKNDE